jgi:hypothetical protein
MMIAIMTASSKEQGFESLLVQHLFASFLGSYKHTKAILASLNNTRQTGTTLNERECAEISRRIAFIALNSPRSIRSSSNNRGVD